MHTKTFSVPVLTKSHLTIGQLQHKIAKSSQIFTKQTPLRRSRRGLTKTAHCVCLAERSGSTIMLTYILGKISMPSRVDRIPSAASAGYKLPRIPGPAVMGYSLVT